MGQPMIVLEENRRGRVFQNVFKDHASPLILSDRIVIGTELVMRISETRECPTVVVRILPQLFRCESLSARLIRLQPPQPGLELFESIERFCVILATKRLESDANELSTFECTSDLLRTLLCLEGGGLCLCGRYLCGLEILFGDRFLLRGKFGCSFCAFLLVSGYLLGLHCFFFTVGSGNCLFACESLCLLRSRCGLLRVSARLLCCFTTLNRRGALVPRKRSSRERQQQDHTQRKQRHPHATCGARLLCDEQFRLFQLALVTLDLFLATFLFRSDLLLMSDATLIEIRHRAGELRMVTLSPRRSRLR